MIKILFKKNFNSIYYNIPNYNPIIIPKSNSNSNFKFLVQIRIPYYNPTIIPNPKL